MEKKHPLPQGSEAPEPKIHWDIYRILFEEAPDSMFMADPQGRLIAVNASVTALTGYAAHEILGMRIQDLIHPEDLIRNPTPAQDLAQGRIITRERRLIRKDGSLVWVENRVRMLPDGNLLGITLNISDRKQVEKALSTTKDQLSEATRQKRDAYTQAEESRARLIAILESTSDLVSTATPDGRLTYLNQAGRRMAGWGQDESLDQKTIADLHPAWALEKIRKEGITTARQKGNWEGETAVYHREGREIPVSQVILAHRGKDDRLHYLSTIMRNISERKRTEEALRKNENLLSSIYRAAPTGIGMVSNRILMTINDRVCEMTGYTREELIGQSSRLLYPSDADFERVGVDKYEQIHKTGTGTVETRWRRKDGTILEVLLSSTPIHPQDLSAGVTFTALDITERKQAEQIREKLQAQLTQSQKMESVGRLAGGVAHDFNNMLGVILGHTELLLMQMQPQDPFFEDLEAIRKAAEHSADLTRQLLAFARKQTVAPRVLDLNEAVEKTLDMLRRLIGEGIDLLWKPGREIAPVKMDPSQIEQVLTNLCINARDAIGDMGRIIIETGLADFDDAYCRDHLGYIPGLYVLLAVSDDGCGMDSETLSHLFEPFFTTKEMGKGTGLGMATVYGIVKQNQGFINVYTEPGQGSTFRLYLPCHACKAKTPCLDDPADPPCMGHETILLVEDEAMILNITQTMLESHGYTVLTAPSPVKAIHLAQHCGKKIHLLLTDVVMPEMDGRTLARKLLSLYPDLKCLFMSGYTANVIAHHGVLEEGVSFIQKPFTLRELALQVKRALNHEGDASSHGLPPGAFPL